MKNDLVSIIIPTYTIEDTALPKASDLSFKVYAEEVTMSGTTLQNLNYVRVIPGSVRVTGTAIDGTLVYTRSTDYEVYEWDTLSGGNNYGQIRRLSAGSITDGQIVNVDYEVWNDHVFLSGGDKLLWGQNVNRNKAQQTHINWGI